MTHDKLRILEAREKELQFQNIACVQDGGDPSAILAELAQIRAKLKTLRRMSTMRAARTHPVRDRVISIKVSADVYDALAAAAGDGKSVGVYVRNMIEDMLKVEEDPHI